MLKSEKWEYKICLGCNNKYPSYKSNKKSKFCSLECRANWQKDNFQGTGNPKFNSKLINCDYCGVPYYVTPSKLNSNQQHFLCSLECRKEWFAKIYSQKEEIREFHRKKAAVMLENGEIGGTQTECQIIINEMLDGLLIRYKNDYNYDYYSIDNYLIDYDLCIEVMGTFWHCDPRFYDEINYEMQSRGIKNDKAKRTYFVNNYKRYILYLWEYDILENSDLCKKLIEVFISNNGSMKEYNSFNYSMNRDGINLKSEIIYPFFYLDSKKIKSLKNIKDTKSKSIKKDITKYITFNCEYCNQPKEQLISVYNKSEHHFCSKKCGVNYYRKIENFDPKHDESKHITFNCEFCDEEKIQNLKHYNRVKSHFCSQECFINSKKKI